MQIQRFNYFSFKILFGILSREFAKAKKWAFSIVIFLSMPVFYLLLLRLVVFTNKESITGDIDSIFFVLIPGIVTFFAITNIVMSVGGSLMMDKMYRSIDDLLMAPIKGFEFILAQIIYGIIYGTIFSVCLTVLLSFFTNFPIMPQHPVQVFLISVNFLVTFVLIGLMIALISSKWDKFSFYMSLLVIPALVMSGAIFPISSFPEGVKKFMAYNPIANHFESLRNLWFNENAIGFDAYTQEWLFITINILLFLAIKAMISRRIGTNV